MKIIGLFLLACMLFIAGCSDSKTTTKDAAAPTATTNAKAATDEEAKAIFAKVQDSFGTTSWFPLIDHIDGTWLNAGTIDVIVKESINTIDKEKAKTLAGAVRGLYFQGGVAKYRVRVLDKDSALIYKTE
jgi:PBP1b-binding outer membrane lipoprotein LpoB